MYTPDHYHSMTWGGAKRYVCVSSFWKTHSCILLALWYSFIWFALCWAWSYHSMFLGNVIWAFLILTYGTPAFISCMFDNKPVHTAIHDIELFLWVLGHLIIKFLGLGGVPREMTPVLKEALSVFVGDHNLQKKKKQILIKDNHFDKLLEQVSPEFEVLKGLMCALYYVLSLAY